MAGCMSCAILPDHRLVYGNSRNMGFLISSGGICVKTVNKRNREKQYTGGIVCLKD